MCGIHAVVSRTPPPPLSSAAEARLRSRGPDHFGHHETRLGSQLSSIFLALNSTVLSLRGEHVTAQPFLDLQSGSAFCWNGEAWRIAGQDVDQGNDGTTLFALLMEASSTGAGRSRDAIINVLRSVEGPFAFVYFDQLANTLYYGRDRLGRRSLLRCGRADGSLILSSVAERCEEQWTEVEADGLYVLDLTIWSGASDTGTQHLEWSTDFDSDVVSNIGTFNHALPVGEPESLLVSTPAVANLRERLITALKLRIQKIPSPPSSEPRQPKLAILFSGGLDCTVLARLCHDLLPMHNAIELLNVAFENPRIAAQIRKQAAEADEPDVFEACPDRITGRRASAELQKVCEGRTFHFVAINIPFAEASAHRDQVISLMYPHNTEMDLSIAFALYFAARGIGVCHRGVSNSSTSTEPMPYHSSARVLLSGLGADELFGGYARHANAFSRNGYAALIDELKLDVSRLGKRNLGRDDRVMAQWGKEVRFPYLDEQVVKWAIELPVWEKCDFGTPEEVSGVEPAKRVLRLLALDLGLEQTAREKKRAIQFGARTAKMENSKVKGTTLIT